MEEYSRVGNGYWFGLLKPMVRRMDSTGLLYLNWIMEGQWNIDPDQNWMLQCRRAINVLKGPPHCFASVMQWGDDWCYSVKGLFMHQCVSPEMSHCWVNQCWTIRWTNTARSLGIRKMPGTPYSVFGQHLSAIRIRDSARSTPVQILCLPNK